MMFYLTFNEKTPLSFKQYKKNEEKSKLFYIINTNNKDSKYFEVFLQDSHMLWKVDKHFEYVKLFWKMPHIKELILKNGVYFNIIRPIINTLFKCIIRFIICLKKIRMKKQNKYLILNAIKKKNESCNLSKFYGSIHAPIYFRIINFI